MTTKVLFDYPFPEWAEQVGPDNFTKGAFHKAIQVSLSTNLEEWVDPPPTGKGLWAYRLHVVAMVLFAIVALVGFFVWFSWLKGETCWLFRSGSEDSSTNETTSVEERDDRLDSRDDAAVTAPLFGSQDSRSPGHSPVRDASPQASGDA